MSAMAEQPILSPFQEISAYEALWDQPKASFGSLVKEFSAHPGRLPSSFVDPSLIEKYKKELLPILRDLSGFGLRIDGDGEFPDKLRDAPSLPRLLYYQGNWDLTYLPSVAVVGTREASEKGLERTRLLVTKLVKDNFVIVSGLARGIDTEAHKTAIAMGGNTIGVIGTPLNQCYPRENQDLQKKIASEFLLITQVPFARYRNQNYKQNRFFFPSRNIIMSALTEATIIVEAGETSGTLVQARAALKQRRKVFILENNFQNPSLTWPRKFEQQGAIRVKDYDDIRKHLSQAS